ncbi:Crp/Fnr family transcriptional regulator [Afifella sp. IM 167]|uniref:Crp/Fnr family transcriptional regulator n=1 Tax=Afifella sp. IM 167 TaxID=2033586 RepID=UPI001CCFA7BA|nr:Crp/Fnr family transcriptional regulator [Afifella sp. IM 167]MBZ8134966.1 transcriptional regulator [Afifella sp. IM 167]
MTTDSLERVLAVNPFFAALPPAALKKIAGICVQRRLASGEALFFKGDPGDGLYAIRRGQITIGVTDDIGQRLTLNVLGSGDVFGEIALLDGQERTADAVAAEPTELFFVPRRGFIELLDREPSIAIQVIELLCARLRSVSEQMEARAFLPLAARLARRIVALSQDYGAELTVSQEELAALTGVTRETVNRQLQEWKEAGWLALGRKRLTVKDEEALRKIAGPGAS